MKRRKKLTWNSNRHHHHHRHRKKKIRKFALDAISFSFHSSCVYKTLSRSDQLILFFFIILRLSWVSGKSLSLLSSFIHFHISFLVEFDLSARRVRFAFFLPFAFALSVWTALKSVRFSSIFFLYFITYTYWWRVLVYYF